MGIERIYAPGCNNHEEEHGTISLTINIFYEYIQSKSHRHRMNSVNTSYLNHRVNNNNKDLIIIMIFVVERDNIVVSI